MKIEALIRKAEELLKSLESDVKSKQEYLDKAPDGKLAIVKRNDTFEYRVRTKIKNGDKKGRWNYKYLNKSEEGLAGQLALKEYYRCCIKDENRIIAALRRLISSVNVINTVQSLLSKAGYVQLLAGQVLTINDKAWKKIEQYHTDTDYRPEGRTVKTIAGFYVRSKSERSIVNYLVRAGIPFIYEPLIMIDGEAIHPDFLIVHPETLELIIWEHLGKIDDSNYRGYNLRRLDKYIEEGFIPDKNLILTWETERYPLDEAQVQMKIDQIF